jgi:hypothetical protein
VTDGVVPNVNVIGSEPECLCDKEHLMSRVGKRTPNFYRYIFIYEESHSACGAI